MESQSTATKRRLQQILETIQPNSSQDKKTVTSLQIKNANQFLPAPNSMKSNPTKRESISKLFPSEEEIWRMKSQIDTEENFEASLQPIKSFSFQDKQQLLQELSKTISKEELVVWQSLLNKK